MRFLIASSEIGNKIRTLQPGPFSQLAQARVRSMAWRLCGENACDTVLSGIQRSHALGLNAEANIGRRTRAKGPIILLVVQYAYIIVAN